MCKHLLKIQRLILALLIFGGGIFYTSSAPARVCFLPDSTDCGEGDVDVPDVQITCATYGGYEAPEACLADLKDKTAQTCILNSGCYYPKCAYDSERNCKRANPDKKCLSQDVDGVKCWYAQAKTCTEMGYKTACDSNEYNSTEVKDKNGNVIIDINNKTCYKCTAKKECKQMKPGVYYGPNDTCPQYRPDRKEVDNVKGSDGQCSTCDYQTCSYYGYQTSCAANQSATEKLTKDQASDGPCYTCEDKPIDKCVDIAANYNLSDSDGITKRYPSINASVTYGKLLGNATYGCGFSVTRTGELNTYTLNTNTVKPGVIDGTDYASVVGFFIKDIEYWVYLGGHLYFEHGGYCYSGLCGEDFFNKDAYLRTKMEIPNELGLYSETAGYCCSSVPGMVKDFKQCVATPKLEKHHPAFYFCKEGALKDNKCYETTYSCSEGYNLVGDKCILPEATCPDGYALDSSKSTSTSYVCSKINYYCENNDKHILSGDKCLCKTNGKIYTIWVEDQETSKQQHEIQWLKLIKRTITTNSQAEVDVVSTAQVNHEMCNIDSATNALNCSHIVSGPIGTLGPDLMNLSKKANGVYTYLNAESEDGSGYYTDVNWKKFSVSINNKIYPVSGIYSQCAETAVIADNGDIYQVKCGKAQTCSEINIFYMNKEQAKQCKKKAVPLNVVGSDGQCYLCGITESCDGKESKIYYIAYPPYYLKGDVAYESGCKCSSPYLVKGISSNTDPLNPGGPININAISTPGGNSSSTEKIKLPTILTGVSSSNPYSVKIDEFQCYGEEHCSAQVVKLDVFEKYAPDVAKKLKEDDNYLIDGGNFYDDFYYYTGRQFKPKSQSINTCDDYVVILGNGNPKACAQISSDYYNYHESCPKGLKKKRLPNVYDSTGAQCYECEKEETCTCPSGYSFDKTSVSNCGITESSGWTFDSKTVCGKTCGKCTAKTCPRGYGTGNISCTSQSANKIPFGYTYSDIFAGDERCKKCKYRYHYTCEDYGKVNVGEGCGLKICSYPCGNTLCSYSAKSDKLYTTLNGSCYEYTKGKTEWYVDE